MITIHTIEDKLKGLDKKVLFAGIAVIVLAVIAGIGYSILGKQGGTGTPAAGASIAVPIVMVEPRIIESVVTAAGALNSKNSSVLSGKVMGRVVELNVHEGDQVAEGRLLMKIDSGEITAQAIQAQAAYNNARLQYDRIKSLYDATASTQMEMDQATLGLETAQAGLRAAKAMESYTIIRAPIAGQIVEKKINLGEMAMPGQPLIKIEDNRNLRLEVTVREQDILQIRPGADVKVQIDAMPGKDIAGKVSQVVPASDIRTHSFIVKIDIPADKGLITGMYGKAFFTLGKHEAIVVPKTAVVEMSGITGVYLLSGDEAALFQMVQLGAEHGEQVEVVTGLKKGDKVVADQKGGRLEGRKVSVVEK